jgi:hypothetical protein
VTQPDYSAFQVGNVVQPISTTSTNPLLQDADPALYYALDFWTFVIVNYPGPRLVQALTNAGVFYANQAIAAAVAQSYPWAPLPEQLENQFRFPLLCAYRKKGQTNWRSVGYETDSWSIELQYILPPMNAAQTEQVIPIFNAIAQALRRKSTDGWDPAYTPPGGVLGDQVWSAPYANVEEAGFGTDRYPQKNQSDFAEIVWLQSGEAGDIYFPTLTMQGYFRERDMYKTSLAGPSKFAGADITGNLKADDGTVLPATATTVVQASTQNPPTISSLSATSGTFNGGTSVTITGTLFLSGPPTVYFGPASDPQYAASVTYNSPTSLTVTTPAMQGAGTVDVTVVNRDGQSGTLPLSFTFV